MCKLFPLAPAITGAAKVSSAVKAAMTAMIVVLILAVIGGMALPVTAPVARPGTVASGSPSPDNNGWQ